MKTKSRLLTTLAAVAVTLAVAMTFALSVPLPANAEVEGPPKFVDYQGTVVDDQGMALGGVHTMQFRIYDAQDGGNLIWAETQHVTVSSSGHFSVRLGMGAKIVGEPQIDIAHAFKGKERYLELTVLNNDGKGTPITPRLAFQTSPFAFVAEHAKLADRVTGVVTATGDSTFTGKTVTGTAIKGTTVTATEKFVGPGTIPLGGIIMWSGSLGEIPPGWQLCNGNGTPDLRGRFVLGAGVGVGPTPESPPSTSLTTHAVHKVGGFEEITLAPEQMPNHTHKASGKTDKGGSHAHIYHSGANDSNGIGNGDHDTGEMGRFPRGNNTASSGAHSHSFEFDTAEAGAGQAHNNMPPFYVLAYIQRVK